jgi:hypothetical protein
MSNLVWSSDAAVQISCDTAVAIKALSTQNQNGAEAVEELPDIPVTHSIVMAAKAASAWTESSSGVLHCSRLIEPFPIHHICSMGLRSALLNGQ